MKIGKTYSDIQKEDENNYIKRILIMNESTWIHIVQYVKKGETIKEEISQGNFLAIDRPTSNFNSFKFYAANQKIKTKDKTEEKELNGVLFATASQYVSLTPRDINFSIQENNKSVSIMNYKLE
jgi:hypothetical protein